MENTTFSIPTEFSSVNPITIDATTTESSESPKRNRLDNLKKRSLLPKVNRTIACIFCEEDRILNPEQYQSYFDYWGDEEKIKRNFICKPCDVRQKENPFEFWTDHHESLKRLRRNLKSIFDKYNNSQKAAPDVLTLQNESDAILIDNKISMANIDFIRETPNNPMTNLLGIKIKNMPFVGEITINPFETRKIKLL